MSKPLTLEHPRHALKKTIEQLSHRKRTWEIWRDFCALSALTIANSVDLFSKARSEREAEYQRIRGTYEPDEFARFPFAFAALVESLEAAGFDDVLGGMFMELDLGSHWHGQFFTPYPLARMMARMTFDAQQLVHREFITLQEPASGAGGLCIAFAEAMHEHEHCNPQQRLHITAIDVDPMCAHMAYVQLSLLHIPAVVIHGNTLTLDEWSHWYTPAHLMGLWGAKLRRGPRVADAPIEMMEPGVADALALEVQQIDTQSDCLSESPSASPSSVSVTTSNEAEQMALF